MKKITSIIISAIVGLLLIIGVAYYIGVDNILSVFKLSPKYLVLFLITSFLIMFLRVLKWKFIVESHNIKVPFLSLFMYRIAGFGVSFLTPSSHVGGEPLRAYLLTKHNVKFTKAFGSVIIDKAIELTLNGFFTVIFVTFIVISYSFNIYLKLFLLLNLFLIIFLISVFYWRTIHGTGFFLFFYEMLRFDKFKLTKKIKKYIIDLDKNTIKLFYQSRAYFPLAFITHLVSWLLSLVEYQLILLMLGYKVNLITAFMIYAATGFAYVIPIPGALGVLEITQSLVAHISRLKPGVGFAVSFIVRGRDGLWTIIGITYLYITKVNFIKQLLNNKLNEKEKVRNKNGKQGIENKV